MSPVAVLLITIGIADACRSMTGARWVPPATAPVVVVVCAALSGLWHLGDIGLLVIAAAAAAGWEALCGRAERTGEHQGAPLAVFGVALGTLIVLSGLGSPVTGIVERWSSWSGLPVLDGVDPTRLLMVFGVVLLQFFTGNQLVRLVLSAVGAMKLAGQPQPSDRLKGGRLLGPMERILILGLALSGQPAAASAVVAAKSIIRFPELNAQKARDIGAQAGDVGIDEVTEYFLVGSFASWIIALGGVGLVLAG